MNATTFSNAFIGEFGTTNYNLLMAAASEHDNEVHCDRGNDETVWAIMICLGADCFSRFAEYHKFEPPLSLDSIKAFLLQFKDYVRAYNGDVDYLAAFCGTYNFLSDSQEVTA